MPFATGPEAPIGHRAPVALERTPLDGLTTEEANVRLAADGPNTLPEGKRRTPFAVFLGVASEPMFLLLMAASALYFALGNLHEALTLCASFVVILFIAAAQEGRTERALAALRDLSSPRARVLRDGEVRTLPGRDLVRGDIVSLAEGDRVPADAIAREGAILSVDESLLTGESAPVTKRPSTGPHALGVPGGKDESSLYSGTLVVSGRGIAEVVRTGAQSELGRLGASLGELSAGRTPLQREVGHVVRRMAVFAIGLSCLLVVLRGLHGGGWLQATLSGLTLAIALLPEEFPVVLTVFLALGAWRMAKVGVLTRQMAAIETLGAVHVLCTDKTGTLTLNRMKVRRLCTTSGAIEVSDGATDLPEEVHPLVEFGVLACPRESYDPMEQAFHELASLTLSGSEHLHPRWNPVREYPLSPELLAVTHVWRSPEREGLVVAAKGAPEAVLDLCHLGRADAEQWRVRVRALATQGLRVLGVARSTAILDRAPDQAHDIPFDMVGIIGLEDPLRPEIRESVALCRRAGIRVLMITGDHAETARAIAEAAGLDAETILTGPEIEQLGDAELGDRLAATHVVARAVPAHKLRIVRALRERRLVIGMTGDGVNDAPALKAADVGIAMGARGTEVAREAASLVLENDDFGSIVAAVRTGRRIYDNLQKAFGYIVAVHVPIAGLSLLPAILGWPSVVTPVHVVFLELIIDPACSIVFEQEPEEADLMDRPPRSMDSELLNRGRFFGALLSGAVVLMGILWALSVSRGAGQSAAMARALAFLGLVLGNLSLLATSRSQREPFWRVIGRRNPALPVLIGFVVVAMVLLLGVRGCREFFSFGILPARDVVRMAVASALPALVLDASKGWAGRA
jgi:Ca2+-transporting ATPase